MPRSHTKKKVRDAELFARWDAKDDSEFARLGITREELTKAQLGLQHLIVLPGDTTYDHDRMLSNPVFNESPCMIVYCATEHDVGIALGLAARTDLPFAVRSGGHCTAGFSTGPGVLIDVSALNGVFPNSQTMQVIVGTGTQMSDLNKTLGPLGLHVPGGECDEVCIGGFVQGGGLGFTSATFGMNCDNVLEMRVMLADGSLVVASEAQNYDLWWAMRGGTGGNFGVLLSVTYRLNRLEVCEGWSLAWPMSTDAEIAAVVQVMMKLQSEYFLNEKYQNNLTLQVLVVYQNIIGLHQPPSKELVPVFMVRGLWVGDAMKGAASQDALQKMPGCVPQFFLSGSYTEVLNTLLNTPQEQPVIDPSLGMPNEDKASRYVARDLTVAEWTGILKYFLTTPNKMSYMYLEIYGGAINTYPIEKSAFIHRNVVFNAVMDVFWYMPKDRQAVEDFINGWNHLMETVWNGHVYQNYVSINVPDYPRNYWGDAVAGLWAVKQKYDPGEKFRFAQQVRSPDHFAGEMAPQMPAVLRASLDQPIDYSGGARAPTAS